LEKSSKTLVFRSKTIEARSKTIEARSKTIEARSKTIEARSKTLEKRSKSQESKKLQLFTLSPQKSQQLASPMEDHKQTFKRLNLFLCETLW